MEMWAWGPEKTINFINDYKANPILWDSSHPDYKRNLSEEKVDVIRNLSTKYDLSVVEFKKKIKNLRSAFHRENNLQKTIAKQGSNYSRKCKPWVFYQHLMFLNELKKKNDDSDEEECEVSTEEIESQINQIRQETQLDLEATSSNYRTIPSTTPRSLKRKRSEFNPKENTDSLEEQPSWGNVRDEHSIYGEYVANEIRNLEARTQVIAKHLINNVLFQAAMGKYDTEDWHQISSSNIDDTGSHFIQPHFMECSASASPSSG